MKYKVFKSGPRKGEPRTKQDRIVRFLLARGMHETLKRYSSRRVFEKDLDGDIATYYVGKNGSVRVGGTYSDSISVTEFFHHMMMLWEKREGLWREE